jgi:hypothetical protein
LKFEILNKKGDEILSELENDKTEEAQEHRILLALTEANISPGWYKKLGLRVPLAKPSKEFIEKVANMQWHAATVFHLTGAAVEDVAETISFSYWRSRIRQKRL